MAYDVFISYSRKDYVDENNRPLVNNIISKIKEALSENGLTYWIDEEGIHLGEEFPTVILDSIINSDCVVFVSTNNSNNFSRWTQKEINLAFEERKPVFPLVCDNSKFNKGIRLLLADVERIDYAQDPAKALAKLVSAVKENKQRIIEEKQRAEEDRLQKEKEEKERLLRDKTLQSAQKTIEVLEKNRDKLRKDLSRIRGEYDLICKDFKLNQEKIIHYAQILREHNEIVNHLLLEDGIDGTTFTEMVDNLNKLEMHKAKLEEIIEEYKSQIKKLESEFQNERSESSKFIGQLEEQLKKSQDFVSAQYLEIEDLSGQIEKLNAQLAASTYNKTTPQPEHSGKKSNSKLKIIHYAILGFLALIIFGIIWGGGNEGNSGFQSEGAYPDTACIEEVVVEEAVESLDYYGSDLEERVITSGFVDMGGSCLWDATNYKSVTPEGSGYILDWDKINRDLSEESNYGLRLPTQEDFYELLTYCNWKIGEFYGVEGCFVSSPTTGNCIFLPSTTKLILDGDQYLIDARNWGVYWTNSLAKDQKRAKAFVFDTGKPVSKEYPNNPTWTTELRSTRCGIRLVLDPRPKDESLSGN